MNHYKNVLIHIIYCSELIVIILKISNNYGVVLFRILIFGFKKEI
jgi:hypothetical protein